MSIYLIRHTETETPNGTCYGQLDVPLKKNHIRDFNKIKKLLPINIDKIYSSPSSRCTDLAEFINPQFEVNNALLELNYGDWEGQLWQEIAEKDLKTWSEDFVTKSPPNGETLLEMFKRVTQFFEKLRMHESENIVIVCHAGVIRCLIAYLIQMPLERIFQIQIGYNKVYRFELNDDPQMDQWYV